MSSKPATSVPRKKKAAVNTVSEGSATKVPRNKKEYLTEEFNKQDPILIKQFLSILPALMSMEFEASGEGSTNSGIHETAVCKFFEENGFPRITTTVSVKPKSKRATKDKIGYVMNRNNHAPYPIDLPYPDGFYSLLQPYSKTGRGAMNPAPDIYLVHVFENRIVGWLGVECKSSKDSMLPMWNEHMPRSYEKGNILYFFSGFNKVAKKKMNTLFTNAVFFNGKRFDEDKFWTPVREFMVKLFNEKYASDFPMIVPGLRQFNSQREFTAEKMTKMVDDTIAFLTSLIDPPTANTTGMS